MTFRHSRLLLLSFFFLFSVSRAGENPNILMIAVDDLRPMLGCYGDPRAKSPNIDELAGEGLVFERAYCNYAKCGPSRLSLMTGLRPEAVGVFGNRDADVAKFRERRGDATPMSRWFREAGYETRCFGKIYHDGWDVPSDWSAPPRPGRDREMWEVAGENPPEDPTTIAERTACPIIQSPDVDDEYFFAGRMAEELSELLGNRDSDDPFFYAVGFRRPHLPFIAPKRYFELHQPDESWLAKNPEPPKGVPFFPWFNSDGYVGMAKKVGEPMPEKMTRADAIAFNGFEMRSYLDVPYRGTISESRQLELLQAYAACISYVDAQIGKILAALEKTGERENTIVLLWSDHGWHLGEMSAWGKMTNYEVANRIPLIISAPGGKTGNTKSLAELVDLYPTLCDLADVKKPSHLEGESLARTVREGTLQEDPVRHEYVRYNGRYHGRAIRTSTHRYVRWVNRKGELELEELYDLETDPHETSNLVPDQPAELEELRELLLER